MVDPNGMAKVHRVQNLQKGLLHQMVIANVVAAFGDTCEQVALGTVLQYDKGAVLGVHYFDQRHYIGMMAGLVV